MLWIQFNEINNYSARMVDSSYHIKQTYFLMTHFVCKRQDFAMPKRTVGLDLQRIIFLIHDFITLPEATRRGHLMIILHGCISLKSP